MVQAIYFPFLIPSPFEELEPFLTESPHAVARLHEASEALGYDLLDAFRATSHRAIQLPRSDWTLHACTQMAALLALADWADESLAADPSVCGGQCFGAWVAAVYSGAMSLADGVELSHINGRLEAEYFDALPDPVGSVVLYLPKEDKTAELLAPFADDPSGGLELSLTLGAGVYAVAGPVRLLDPFAERLRDFGGRPLYFSNRVEHCSWTGPLQQMVTPAVHSYPWPTPRVPFLSETGALLHGGQEVRDDLLDSMTANVRWQTTVAGLKAAAVDTVYVVGTSKKRNLLSRVLADDGFTVVTVTPELALARETVEA